MTREEARQRGYDDAMDAKVPLYNLTGHMIFIEIPLEHRAAYIGGVEDALIEQGYNIEANEP